MIHRLETKGIVLSTYNRYVDDTSATSDVIDTNEKGKLFSILEEELNKLHPIGNSIRVTGEQMETSCQQDLIKSPLINKTLPTETTYQQGLIVGETRARYVVLEL